MSASTDVAAKRAAARKPASPATPEDAKAVEQGKAQAEADKVASDSQPSATSDEVHVIHVVEDGFTALGKVWYRGEEIRVAEGSDEWRQITDTKGKTFYDLADDEAEQIARYGKVLFRSGPWPHERLTAEDIERMEMEANRASDPEEANRLRKRAQRLAAEVAPPGSGS